jgi:TPR repeat protein
MRKLTVLYAVAVIFNITNASAQNASLTDCDMLAANPDDPQRKASGVAFDKVDASAAIPACEAAVRQYPNDARLNYQLGRAHQKGGNYQGAIESYKKAADQGYTPALSALGFMYAVGQGVTKDEAQAVSLYRKAAEQGYAAGQNNLGVMYAKGQGVAKDEAKAVSLYRKAAELGCGTDN